MTTTVTAHFIRSNGTRVEFTGTLIREYTARNGVIEMVEVKTANGSMHAQRANATVIKEIKRSKVEENVERVINQREAGKLSAAMFEGVKVGKLVKGDKILVEDSIRANPNGLCPTTRVTKGRVVTVTNVTYQLMQHSFRASRQYMVETDEGKSLIVMAPTVIRKLKSL